MVSASRGAWLGILAGGCSLVSLAWYLPQAPAAGIWICVQLLAMGAASYALTHREAIHRSGWWVVLTSCGLGVASDALYVVPADERSDWAWVIVLAARYALLVVGLFMLLGFRRAQTAEQAFLDAGIVSAGLAIVGWTFLIEPALNEQQDESVTYTFLALDALMLACLVRILIASRTPNMLLLAAAGAVVISTDAAGILHRADLGTYQPGGAVHLAWQVSGVLVAAAVLHPSFRDGYGSPATTGPPVPPIRFAVFVVVALVAPVVPMVGLYYAGHDVPADLLPALAGSTALTAALLVLLVVRLGLVARVASVRARAMNVQAATLLMQSNALRQALAEQEALQDQLTQRALHDPLTGLANRALLTERLEKALAADGPHPGALLLLDLDGFKYVNDTLGHPAGDELLVQVAGRLRATMDCADTVARLGGDEFAILITGDEEEKCRCAAHQVIEALRLPYPLAERQVRLAASGGLLPLRLGRPWPSGTLHDADLALYAAKEAGKNQVVEFHPRMREARMRYSQLAAGVRTALSSDALTVLYQPIVELATGRPVALEALVRWRSADGRQVPPNQFISVAEEIGLVGEIGARVLRDACAQASRWHRDHGVALSVNVSGQQLATLGFADRVLGVLADTGLPPQALIVEITETALVGAREYEPLVALRRHGVRIAVDDFGTGHSSLSSLHRLPIDILKLDPAFTATADAKFVGAILGLGAGLDVPTVAEGVETARQAELLRELACPMAQGYHFAAPCPADDVTAYLSVGAGAPRLTPLVSWENRNATSETAAASTIQPATSHGRPPPAASSPAAISGENPDTAAPTSREPANPVYRTPAPNSSA